MFKRQISKFIDKATVIYLFIILVCSAVAIFFVFYYKYSKISDTTSNIIMEERFNSYMNLVEMMYKDISKYSIINFQEQSKKIKAISTWIFKESAENRGLIVLASSQHPELIGKLLPENICKIDKIKYQHLIQEGHYKKGYFVSDNTFEFCYFKKYDDVIIGYNTTEKGNLTGVHDPHFWDWFFMNMKLAIIMVSTFALLALIQYIVFYRRLKDSKATLEQTNDELISKNNEIETRLYMDSLTGLPNKISLQRDIKDMKKPKVIVMDIDDFSKMNNYFGVKICNQILRYIANLAKDIAKKENMSVYRVGADQFAFLEDSEFFIDRYEELAVELLESLKGLVIDVQRDEDDKQDLIEIHCTIGFCLDEENTMRKAMLALEFAKKHERDYFCYFKSIDDTVQYQEYIMRSNIIRDAIVNDKIVPYYQPIFNQYKQVVKYETLMRIKKSTEIISPNVFLEVSKRIKRYIDIEKMLIEKSFKLLSEKEDTIISVNLSGRDMTDGDMSVFIIDRMNKYKIANRVIFEILEDENVENVERVSKFIERVKRMGAKIAIDDFGSGYSNFSYILKLKPDYIKIDGSIIKNIDTDDNSRSIASAIIAFAKRLNIIVIAEFVHSKSVFETCVALGVDEFQGFYLGEPSHCLL